MAALANALLDRALADNTGHVTLIGITVSNLHPDSALQLELDIDGGHVLRPGSAADRNRRRLDRQVDEIRERFGRDSVRYGEKARHPTDDFRRLAQKD